MKRTKLTMKRTYKPTKVQSVVTFSAETTVLTVILTKESGVLYYHFGWWFRWEYNSNEVQLLTEAANRYIRRSSIYKTALKYLPIQTI